MASLASHYCFSIPNPDPMPTHPVSGEVFWSLCLAQPDARLERSAEGELVVRPLSSFEVSECSGRVFGQLFEWHLVHRLGRIVGASAGYRLADGATWSPHAS